MGAAYGCSTGLGCPVSTWEDPPLHVGRFRGAVEDDSSRFRARPATRTASSPPRKEHDMPAKDTTPKTWLITGAGRGMGVDFAQAALSAGHAVVATGRDPDTVRSAVGEHEKDRKSTRLNSSHANISYAVFCLKKKKKQIAALRLTY